jgi:hypothetical protein
MSCSRHGEERAAADHQHGSGPSARAETLRLAFSTKIDHLVNGASGDDP